MVTILKVRRQTHLCSVRCIVADAETGQMALGNGRKALETCIAIPVANLPKMKIEAVETASRKKGSKNKPKTLPVVAPEPAPQPVPAVVPVPADMPAGLGEHDIAPAEQPAPAPAEVPAAVEAAV
jgi:hypothetical protein